MAVVLVVRPVANPPAITLKMPPFLASTTVRNEKERTSKLHSTYQPLYGTRMEEWSIWPTTLFSFLLLEKLPCPLQTPNQGKSQVKACSF
jgi:hypothetical protein